MPPRATRSCPPGSHRNATASQRDRPSLSVYTTDLESSNEGALTIRYARNQREGLSRFLTDGRLPLHNLSELNLRRKAVGRKNWLFVRRDEGGRNQRRLHLAARCCRMHVVEPWSSLRDILCLLPGWSRHRVLELSPLRWAETQADPDAQARLALDPYRVLTLGVAYEDTHTPGLTHLAATSSLRCAGS